jgi:hypothetical protein
VAHHAGVDCTSRIRLSITLAARIDNAGERRSRYHNAFHHAGTTMIASPRNTARRARSANISGAIGPKPAPTMTTSSCCEPMCVDGTRQSFVDGPGRAAGAGRMRAVPETRRVRPSHSHSTGNGPAP